MDINDNRLEILKDITRCILNETTDMDDKELVKLELPKIDDIIEFYDKDSVSDEDIKSLTDELTYDNFILKLSSQIELMGRKMELEKRVYSGETIVGDKMKMHWTEDGWVEGEKNEE